MTEADQKPATLPRPPAPAGNEFADLEQELKVAREDRYQESRRIPTVGEPGKGRKKWNVTVRHSPFLLKQVEAWAESPESAKRLFLDAAQKEHQTTAARQKGPERDKAAARVMTAYTRGLQAQETLEWVILPSEEVERKRRWLKRREDELRARDRQLQMA